MKVLKGSHKVSHQPSSIALLTDLVGLCITRSWQLQECHELLLQPSVALVATCATAQGDHYSPAQPGLGLLGKVSI